MSLISKFKGGSNKLLVNRFGQGTNGVGLVGFAVDKAERWGGSYLLGYLKAKHRDDFAYKNIGYDLIGGVVGTLAGAALNIFSGGRSHLAPHLERLGDVGLQAHFLQLGAQKGADTAGYETKVVSANAKKSLGPKVAGDVVGAIPQAKPGTVYLTDQDILSALQKRA